MPTKDGLPAPPDSASAFSTFEICKGRTQMGSSYDRHFVLDGSQRPNVSWVPKPKPTFGGPFHRFLFCPPRLLVFSRGSDFLGSKHSTNRTTSGDTEQSPRQSSKNLHRIPPAAKFSSWNTRHNIRPTANIFGDPWSCQGELRTKGKQRPTVSGSYIFDVQ